jgi:hypothetical protein
MRGMDYRRILDAFKIDTRGLEGLRESVKTQDLLEPIDSFSVNIERVLDTLMMLPFMVYWARAIQRLVCQANVNISNVTDFSNCTTTQFDDLLTKTEFEKLHYLWVEHQRKYPFPDKEALDSMAQISVLVAGSGSARTESGFYAVLANQLTGTWTAFEALATDLWVKAVNLRPMTLGLAGLEAKAFDKKSKRVPIHPKRDVETPKPVRNPIRLDLLLEHHFNLSDKLGTILLRSRKFDFNRADGIMYAYAVLFGDAARKVFKKHNDALLILEAIRNVLVHKGGLIDGPFQERARKDPVLSKLNVGDRLPLGDALIPPPYFLTVSSVAKELIALVDDFLQRVPR